MLPATLGSRMLDLTMPPLHDERVHHQHQQQQFFPFPERLHEVVEHSPSRQQVQHASSCDGRGKQHPLTVVGSEEHTFVGEEAGAATDGRKKQRFSQPALASPPWQRMRWTDGMVRLLIMVVYCVGEDGYGGTEGGDQHHQPASAAAVVGKGKKGTASAAPGGAAAAALPLQKKGKWKSVSNGMMEKGFYVSPQQCEDKFNDLNKRYKRVIDLLGKGTACRVVENQALLDTMDHLSRKAKEEAHKLLNSKHLFFREMCAYHNSGGTAACSSSVAGSPLQPPPSQQPQPDHQESHQQQQCSHHPLDSSHSVQGGEAVFAGKGGQDSEDNVIDDDEDDREEDADNDEAVDDDFDDEEDDYDEGYILKHKNKHQHQQITQNKHGRDEDEKALTGLKSARTSQPLSASSISASPSLSLSLSTSPRATMSTSMQKLRCELLESLATVGGEQQQRHWLRMKVAELEEQHLGYKHRALEMERKRYKWLRFSSKKEREMERMKLRNEQVCLENDCMLLLLRQKQHELVNVSGNTS